MKRSALCTATKVPRPCRRTRICSATRSSVAWRSVPMDTPSAAASAASLGSAAPAWHCPDSIARSSALLTCRYRGGGGVVCPRVDRAQQRALPLPVQRRGARAGDERGKDGGSDSLHGAHIVALGAAIIHGRGARHARHPSHMNDWFDTGKYADRHCPIATFDP